MLQKNQRTNELFLMTTFNFIYLTYSTMMKDVEAHYKNPNLPYPSEDNPLLYEMTSYLESTGINNPCLKVFKHKQNIIFNIHYSKMCTETFGYSERVFIPCGSK